MRVEVIGAGVAGLTAAYELARRGAEVELVERQPQAGLGCSRLAGGMIAPWCELPSAEPLVAELGAEALDFWTKEIPVATLQGSLVVAPAQERGELVDFSRRTQNFQTLDRAGVAALEPDLDGRFDAALYFSAEAHLDPKEALAALVARLRQWPNVTLRFGAEPGGGADWILDARGFSARDALPALRGVKGEALTLRSPDLRFSRPLRMLHPKRPVYIVPRGGGVFMVGATMIENEEAARVTARALAELIGSAYALHPAFAEAEVLDMGSDLRPAFPDNLPRLIRRGRTLYMNGLYRHGFLLAPALARRAALCVLEGARFPEVCDAD